MSNAVNRCWIENTDASNATSCLILKSDAGSITGFTCTRTFADGGGVVLYVDNQNASLDNPGANGNPSGIVFDDVRVGRNYRDSVLRYGVPSANISLTNVRYADTGDPIPALFVDDSTRANENLEDHYFDRVSGVAGGITIDSNNYRTTTTTQTTYLLKTTYGISTADHLVGLNVKGGSNQGWIILRYTDENNYVGMQINSLVPTLYTRIAGTFTARVTGSAYSAGDLIEPYALGSVIGMYRNGTLIGSYDMGAGVLASGRVGMQARSGLGNPFGKNFRARSLPA